MTFPGRTQNLLLEVEHLQLDVNIWFRRGHLQTGQVLICSAHDVSENPMEKPSINAILLTGTYEVLDAPEHDVAFVGDVIISDLASVERRDDVIALGSRKYVERADHAHAESSRENCIVQ